MQSDAEVICTFMAQSASADESLFWWRQHRRRAAGSRADDLTLNELHEVEERLTHAQVGPYIQELYRVTLSPDGVGRQDWRLLNATAEQKTKALAQAIRGDQ